MANSNDTPSNDQYSTSSAVEQTQRMFPATNPVGFQLDGAVQVTDPRLRTLPRPPSASGAPNAAPTVAGFASNTVQGPASIVELARALNVGPAGNGPQMMYEWVYSNIEWEAGWGANRGALGTLLDGMGTQFDQAMLLAALLRQAGYTANIVQGSIRLTEAQYQAWWNVTDIWAAQSYCANQFIPIVTAPTWTGSTYYMDIKHVWVQWVNGATTYIFDPSYKTYTRKTGLSSSALATALGYNATTFMTNAQSGATVTTDYAQNIHRSNIRSNLQTFTANLVTYIKNNAVGTAPAGTATIDDVLGGQSIVAPTLPLLQTSLPYQKPGDSPTVWTGDVPASFKPTIQIQFPNWSTPGVWDFTYQTTSENLAGKRLTLWYDANRVPKLYLDGTLVATGLQQPVGTWTSIYLTVTHPAYAAANYPVSWQQFYQTNFQWWQQYIYTVGSYLIGSAWGNLGDGQMSLHQKRTKANEAAGGSATSEPVLGEQMAHLFYSWTAQNSKVCELVNKIKNCHTTYSHQVGVIGFNSNGGGALTGDLAGVSGSTTNLANDTTQTPINDAVLAMHGVALEAAVGAQETKLTPGVSTTSVIDKAVQLGDRIYKGTGSNWNTGSNVRNTLVANGFNGTDMDNLYNWYIQYGNSVLIHNQPSRTLGSWSGWAYWAYPTAGAYGIINGGGKGLAAPAGPPIVDEWGRLIDPETGQPRSWDPIGLASGDFSYETTDLKIGSGEYPYSLPFTRHYNSSRQYVSGPLGRGWKHCYKMTAFISSDGLLAMGAESAIQAACSIAELFVTTDLFSDTTRPVAKLVTATLADNWWVDQIVNNTVVIDFPSSSFTFIKQPDGTYTAPLCGPTTLTLSGGVYTLKLPDQLAYNFSASTGNLSSIVFPNGMTVTLTYTGNKLTTVSNGLTRTLTFSYTGNDLTSVSDGTGRSVTYGINGTTKNLDSATDPDSKTVTYIYDQPGRLTQIKRPANPTIAVVSNLYDSLDRVKEQRDALNNLWQYYLAGSRAEEIDPQNNRKIIYMKRRGLPIRVINKVSQVTSYQYDGLDRRTKTILPEGNEIRWTYDLKSNILTETKVAKSGSGLANIVNSWTYHATYNKPLTYTNAKSKLTTITYDAATGNLLTIQRPVVGGLTPTVTITYNSRGQIRTKTEETSRVTEWNYDTTTEKLTSIVVDQGAGKLNLTISLGYNSRGDLTAVTDARGKTTTFAFDVMRRMTQKTDPSPLSYITKHYYDANGNRWKSERQTGNVLNPWQTYIATFNYADQLKTLTNPSNDVTTWDYNNMRLLWKLTDSENQVWEYIYDAEARLFTAKDPALVIAETRLYTNNGKIQSVKDARNNTTSFSYDGHDRLDRTTYADSSYEQNQSYDGNGNVLTLRTRSGSTIINTYDDLDRVVSRAPSGQPTITLTYDLAGRLTKASKPVVSGDPSTGNFEFFYDTAGRFWKEQYPDGKIVQHILDANGNTARTTWPDGWYCERVYDEINRQTDIKLNGAATAAVHFNWDPLSRNTSTVFENGVTSTNTFEPDDDLATIAHTFVGSSVNFTLGYNKLHQLTTQLISDGANYMWHPTTGGTITYGTADSVNKYPTVGGVSFSYNTNGCLTGDGVWTFTYDTENHLLTANKTGTSVTNRYDPVHRQREHQVGAILNRFIYDGWRMIADYNNTTLQNRYIYGLSADNILVRVNSGGTKTYYHANHQGSVVAQSALGGTVANRYKYSPFGESPALSGTIHGYTGQRFESESGLYYYKYRYYSPKIGRFLQPDPIGYSAGDLNLYGYVKNDPLNATDSLGLYGDFGEHAAGPGANGGRPGDVGGSPYPANHGPLGAPGYYVRNEEGQIIGYGTRYDPKTGYLIREFTDASGKVIAKSYFDPKTGKTIIEQFPYTYRGENGQQVTAPGRTTLIGPERDKDGYATKIRTLLDYESSKDPTAGHSSPVREPDVMKDPNFDPLNPFPGPTHTEEGGPENTPYHDSPPVS